MKLILFIMLLSSSGIVACDRKAPDRLHESKDGKSIEILMDVWVHHLEKNGKGQFFYSFNRIWPGFGSFQVSSAEVYENGNTVKSVVHRGEDKNRIIFSTSDNTDPKENGRRYSLRAIFVAEFHRRVIKVKGGHEKIVLDLPTDIAVVPWRLMIKNSGDRRVRVNLRDKGLPDLSSVKAMVESVVSFDMSDEEKAIALWEFLKDNRYHYYPSQEDHEPHDPVRLVNVYGYGFCDDASVAFMVLCEEADLLARSVGLTGHVVAEVYYDGGWHMFDVDHEIYYVSDNGKILSVDELSKDPGPIKKTKYDPVGYPTDALSQLYVTIDNNYYGNSSDKFDMTPLKQHRVEYVLNSEDEAEFSYIANRSVHSRSYPKEAMPPVVGNGTLVRKHMITRNDLSAGGAYDFREEWPYVMLDSSVEIDKDTGQAYQLYAYLWEGVWFNVHAEDGGNHAKTFRLSKYLQKKFLATYSIALSMRGFPKDLSDDWVLPLTMKTDFQFASKSLPYVSPGHNEFEITLQDPVCLDCKDFAGDVEVTLEWLQAN